VILAFCVATGIAIVALTAFGTARAYAQLPNRVPMHFAFDGAVNGYGPRPMVWSIVAVQVLIGVSFGNVVAGFAGPPLPGHYAAAMAAFGDLILLLLARAQKLIIETALSGKTRADLRSFWAFFCVTMLSAVLFARIVGR